MQPADIPSATEMSIAANWNQTVEDWHNILKLSPQGCHYLEDHGKIVSTATLLPYGSRLAWVGMVLTRPEYRRRGLARRLMEDLIEMADQDGIGTLKLDATDDGRPLYENLGFIVETTVERWARKGVSSTSMDCKDASRRSLLSDELLSMDAEAFGASRRDLLNLLRLSGRCDATSEGYAMSRAGRQAKYFGPCVATSCTAAEKLIGVHLQHGCVDATQQAVQICDWFWDLLPENSAAVRCAEELGFMRQRTLWRMRRGEPIANNDAMVYAIAGFELG